MPLLYFWRGDNYRRDLDLGAGYHLNQDNPLLHDIEVGDSLWAFTRREDGVYALAAELIISAKTNNPRGYRYGRYRVWGDLRTSRYFSIQGQPDITRLVRCLSIRAGGDVLGRAFQGHAAVRGIAPADHQIMSAYAKHLALEPRARLVPEERLEALLISGDEASVDRLVHDEPSGLAEDRRRYFSQIVARRNRQLVNQLQQLYEGCCQICRWQPRDRYGVELCEAHHIRWLSRGGEDELHNLVLLCPNHHRAIHRCDAPFNWSNLSFVFDDFIEALLAVQHELGEM